MERRGGVAVRARPYVDGRLNMEGHLLLQCASSIGGLARLWWFVSGGVAVSTSEVIV